MIKQCFIPFFPLAFWFWIFELLFFIIQSPKRIFPYSFTNLISSRSNGFSSFRSFPFFSEAEVSLCSEGWSNSQQFFSVDLSKTGISAIVLSFSFVFHASGRPFLSAICFQSIVRPLPVLSFVLLQFL